MAGSIYRLKQLNDALVLKDSVLEAKSRSYRARAASRYERIKTLREYKEYERLWKDTFARSEFETMTNAPVPVIMSSRIGELLEVYGRVPNLFPHFPMTSR